MLDSELIHGGITPLQADIGGGAIAVIEFATVDAEELQGLVEFEGWGDAMP